MIDDSIPSLTAFLRDEFLREAKVINAERGYISVSSFNLRMNPVVLKSAARVISTVFNDDQIDTIHGIPHSGNYLATAVAIEMTNPVHLHASRKDQNIPSNWKDVYREEIRSFTTSDEQLTVFSGINLSFVKKGDRALILDDVCATGETGYRIVQGLQQRGVIVVGFAVLFDKVFQGGLEYIESLGVKTFSCVRVLEIGNNDKVVLANHKEVV
jgi:adenine/guanine phosphoribosyltransferase-like PRPP-binding protein